MKEFIDVIRHREYIGFLLGAMGAIVAYELHSLTLVAFISLLIAFVGFPLARKYGN